MAFATRSIDIALLRTNVSLVGNAAKIFGVDTILTTVAAESFSGPVFPELSETFPEISENFPGHEVIDRTSMNTWEDGRITERINQIGKKRLVMAGLWTGVCIVGPALSALDQGFEVYFITEAIKRAGSTDPDKMVAELEKTDYEGTIGRIQFYGKDDEFTHGIKSGPTTVSGLVFQWQDSKQVVVWPEKIAEGKLKFPAFVKLSQ